MSNGHRLSFESEKLHRGPEILMSLFAQNEAHSLPRDRLASTGLIMISTVAFLLIIRDSKLKPVTDKEAKQVRKLLLFERAKQFSSQHCWCSNGTTTDSRITANKCQQRPKCLIVT